MQCGCRVGAVEGAVHARAGYLSILALGSALAACAPVETFPDPVEVSLENSDQAVVDQITALLADARGEPASARARALLGMAYEMSDRLQAAHDSYAQAALIDPREPRWSYLQAVAQAELGDLEAALTVLDRSIALDDAYAPSYLYRGEWLLDLGRVEEAGEAFARALQLESSHPAPQIGIAKVHLRSGRPAEAVRILERLAQLVPTDPLINQLLGQAYREIGKLSAARAALARATPSKAPQWPDPWHDERFQFQTGFGAGMVRASKLMKQGKNVEALALLEELRLERPDDRQLLNNLSVAYRANGQPKRAFEVLRDGLESHPDYFPFHLNISSDYQSMGDNEQALRHLERVVEINPSLAQAWERIGSIHFTAGDLPLALSAFEEASRNDPGSTSTMLYCSIILGRLGRWDESIVRLQRALTIDPDMTPVLVTLGEALAEVGRYDESRQALSRARKMAPGSEHLRRAEQRLAELETTSR